MADSTYPLAPNGVFETIQGEGFLLGMPMVFVRLAGCSIGCARCDTDYSVAERCTAREIAERVCSVVSSATDWLWLTGGEPADHDLLPLVRELRPLGLKLALATAGHKQIWATSMPLLFDWLSVSPHEPEKWVVKGGHELKIVPGLNGKSLADFAPHVTEDVERLFPHCYVQPCDGIPETVAECLAWVQTHHGWKMTPQAHKQWRLP